MIQVEIHWIIHGQCCEGTVGVGVESEAFWIEKREKRGVRK